MARRLRLAILILVLSMMSIGLSFPIVNYAGTQEEPMLLYANSTVCIGFSDIYTSASINLVQADVEVVSASTNDTWVYELTTLNIYQTLYKVNIRDCFVNLANGIYKVRIRVYDSYSNCSEWSDVFWVNKLWRTVDKPSGCRIMP